jgi:4-amino-4-deoxy-L-arabinose transferase-like glycosyltransferase
MSSDLRTATTQKGLPDLSRRGAPRTSRGTENAAGFLLPPRDFVPSVRLAGAKTAAALVGSVLFAAALAFPMLDARGIFSPAEARYALIAREMVESGDWVQPRLNHVRYDEKPPLLYWAIAAAYAALGPSDFSARLPSAAAYVGTAALTFGIARELLGPSAAPLAALVYATSIGTFLFGRFVFTDTLLVFCTTLSLYGLTRVVGSRGGSGPALAFHLGMALAGLSKGLVGLFLPAGTAVTFALLYGGSAFWRRLRPALGLGVLTVVFLPWHVLLAVRDPAFLEFYIVNEHVRRFLNARVPIDYVPLSILGFWMSTLFWLLPWTLYLPAALRVTIKDDRARLALPLLWSAWVIGFFTLSRSRLEYYALPAVPALAVIVAAYWQRVLEFRVPKWEVQVPALLLLGAALVSFPKLWLFPQGGLDLLTAMVSNVDGYYREYFASHPDQSFALANEALQLARPFALLLIAIGSGVTLLVGIGRRRLALAMLVVGIVPCLGVVDLGHRLVTPDRSQREFARVLGGNWSDGAHLVVAGDYEDLCGISYYTNHPTEMLDDHPEDLLWGYRRGDASDLFLTPEQFRREWESPDRVFVLSEKSFPLPDGIVLAESPRDVLRTNHPAPATAAQRPWDR